MSSFRLRPINCQKQSATDSETVTPRGILNAAVKRNITGKVSSTLQVDECKNGASATGLLPSVPHQAI